MNDLDSAPRQPQSGHTDLPPYLDDPAEGMLAVARDLYENPTRV